MHINATEPERLFYDRLKYMKLANKIKSFDYQPAPIILHKIGRGRKYTPDFKVIDFDDEIIFYEVKGGYIREDAMLKFEWAAMLNPDATFIMMQYKRRQWTLVKYIKEGKDLTSQVKKLKGGIL